MMFVSRHAVHMLQELFYGMIVMGDGSVVVISNPTMMAVGRLHIGTQATTYNGFTSGSLRAYGPMLFRDGFGAVMPPLCISRICIRAVQLR